MAIVEEVNSGIKEAMKAKDKVRLGALRGVKKELIEAKAAKGVDAEITDDEAIKIITKMVKQRKDSISIYNEQGRADLAETEVAEVEVLSVFLPEQLTGEKLEEAVKAVIEKVGASSMKEMGKVMGVASKELAGKADGKEISELVKKLLA
ncbi:GatB/YqeY domain-containing protein [Saccharicrinis aurantiacus]|uniref:GatB/YqeY domain-containing protein n=1 Tax=Saccharicrinis aurantiacus TaxID=1849719 RepID=UPI00094F905E|nr:GatB/YqeY domain-containing protein [Saccharicrinis aurantiacus]